MSLNAEQQAAVDAEDRTILCLACAGAGKTHTLLARIERLVNEGVDPSSILALTFTNAAALEMKQRYDKLFEGKAQTTSPEFRTFHSFCYSLIVKDQEVRQKIGYSSVPSICEDEEMEEIEKKIKLQINCKLSKKKLLGDESKLSRAELASKQLFEKALNDYLRRNGLITFDIMCYKVCELFVANDESIAEYKTKYKYLICDEMQDTDPKQFRFLESFPETTNFFLVGDILQSIYGFRGCSNEYIKSLAGAPGWKVIKMNKNYRSSVEICDYVNFFSKYSKDEYRIEMEGQFHGEKVEVIRGSHNSYANPVDRDHASILVDKLRANPRETAILCRSNKECEGYMQVLRDAGIQFNTNHKSLDTLSLLRGVLDNRQLLNWLTTFLSAERYGDYIRLSSYVPDVDLKWFCSTFNDVSKVRDNAEKAKFIRMTLADPSFPTSEKMTKIANCLGMVTNRFNIDTNVKLSSKEIIEFMYKKAQEEESSQIYIGTIHSVKGLEYDTVYVMGVNDSFFYMNSEETRNLFYVAITRAKNHLTVFRR